MTPTVEDIVTMNTTDNYANTSVPTIDAGPSSMAYFRFIVNTCIQGPIAVLGLIGNIMAVIVLFRQKTKATTTIILKALTITDTLYLVSMFLLVSLRYINAITNTMNGYMSIFHYIFRWFYPQLYVYRTMITWLTVLLTIDRYIVVCKPLHAPRICTKKRAWIEVIVVLTVSLVYNLPRFFEYEISDEIARGYARTPMTSNKVYVFLYRIALFLLLMYIIPLLVLLIANTRLIITFKKAEKMRSQMANTGQQTKDITYMVIATVFFFFLANVPAFIAQLLWALYEVFKPSLNHILPYYSYHSNISNILVTLNSAINFVIYCLCSRHFRQVFMRTFGCGQSVKGGDKAAATSVTMTSRVTFDKTNGATSATNGTHYNESKTHI